MLSKPRSSFGQIATVTRHELNKFVSNKRIYIFAALLAALILFMTYMASSGSGKILPEEFANVYLMFMLWIILLGVILFSASSIVSEFEERTALLVFPRPIKKGSIFCGKLCASLIVTCGFIGVYYLVTCISSIIFTGSICPELYISFGFSVLYVFAATGIAFLLSSIFKKGSTATIMTVMMLLLALPLVNQLLKSREIDPWFWLFEPSTMINEIIPRLSWNGYEYVVMATENINLTTPAVVMLVWFVVTTVSAFLIFKRREF